MTDVADRLYERVLVLRCQTGDEDGFAELVERYQSRLRFFVRTMIRDDDRVDDVLQDVWMEVFRAIPRLSEPAAFRVWVYRIAQGRIVRELRRRRMPPPLPTDVHPADPAAGVDEDHLMAETAEEVRAALNTLPPEHRDVLMLHYLEDMPYEEIASVIGCPVGTVRSRLYYARRAVRSVLERTNNHE